MTRHQFNGIEMARERESKNIWQWLDLIDKHLLLQAINSHYCYILGEYLYWSSFVVLLSFGWSLYINIFGKFDVIQVQINYNVLHDI